jgi:hypothetical protein
VKNGASAANPASGSTAPSAATRMIGPTATGIPGGVAVKAAGTALTPSRTRPDSF